MATIIYIYKKDYSAGMVMVHDNIFFAYFAIKEGSDVTGDTFSRLLDSTFRRKLVVTVACLNLIFQINK